MAKGTVPTIKVNKKEADKASYRGARAAWLEALVKADGKTLAAFTEAVLAAPPSTPKTGKHAGKCEPPMGWVNFFVREAIVEIVNK